MGTRLQLGIGEDRAYKHEALNADAFSSTGRYRTALLSLERLFDANFTQALYSKYWSSCLQSGSTLPAAAYDEAISRLKDDVRWILIYESEQARSWKNGPPDYMSTIRKYKRSAKDDSRNIKKLLVDLEYFDKRHSYLLRNSLSRALQDFMSSDQKRRMKSPDLNAKNGFVWKTLSGPEVNEHEFQYISRLSLFNFSEMLQSWHREIDFMFKDWPAHWMEFGAIRFADPISPRAASKINVAQLGLIARLMSRLRDFTNGYGVQLYGTGQPIPSHGKPCWEIVADFVNCALETPDPLSGDTARRVFQSIAQKHEIRTQAWPRPAKSESQIVKT